MKSSKQLLPVIHLNGTSAIRLQNGALVVREAAEALLRAMTEEEFHARDYYPHPAGSFEAARAIREEQLRVVRSIRDHAYEIVELTDEHLNRKDPLRTPRAIPSKR